MVLFLLDVLEVLLALGINLLDHEFHSASSILQSEQHHCYCAFTVEDIAV